MERRGVGLIQPIEPLQVERGDVDEQQRSGQPRREPPPALERPAHLLDPFAQPAVEQRPGRRVRPSGGREVMAALEAAEACDQA